MTDFDMPPAAAGFAARGGWLVNALAAEFGLTKEQAAGIVGNLGFESGGFRELQEIAPTVEGSAGGFGWAQWTGARRRSYEAWCAQRDLAPSSDAANFGYLCVELHGAYRYTIDAVKHEGTVEAAVFSVGQTYERPGGTTPTHLPGYDGRVKYAREALAGASGATGAQGTAPAATPGAETAAQAPAVAAAAPRRTEHPASPPADDGGDSEAEAEDLNRQALEEGPQAL